MTAEVGSVVWMAPEVIKHNKYSVAADVYSFGVIMWELCMRKIPYDGLSQVQIMLGIAQGTLRPEISKKAPPAWNDLMCRCWAENPDDRPTFAEILKELKEMSLPKGTQMSPK